MKKFLLYILLIISGLFISWSYTNKQPFNSPVDYNNYEKSWKKIEELEKKGLTQSAYEEVQKIHKKAKRENNSPQTIKSYLHESKYVMKLKENSELLVVDKLKKEIQSSSFPTKPILQSILGDLYWQYFQANRYKFLNRTKLKNAQNLPEDFRTWALQELLSESHRLFAESLKNSKKLERITLSDFNAIVNTQKKSAFTLSVHDFLALRALDFYTDSKSSLTKPKNAFLFNQKQAIAPLDDFLAFEFSTKDSLSSEWNTLGLFQKLLRWSKVKSSKTRLIEYDRRRIKFTYTHSAIQGKEQLYRKTLGALIKKYPNHSSRSNLDYDLAKWYRKQGNLYNFKNGDQYKNDLKKAVDICQRSIKKFPNTIGAKNCKNLMNDILSPSLVLLIESYVPTQWASAFRIEYRNIPKIHLKLVRLDERQWENLQASQYRNTREKSIFNTLNQKKELKKWSYSFRGTNDHQNHSSIGKIPKAKTGQYALLFSSDDNFDTKKSVYGYQLFQVTDLAFSVKPIEEKRTLLKVQDRTNGNPIKSARIQPIFRNSHRPGDILRGGLIEQSPNKITTDSKGEATLEFSSKKGYFDAKVEHRQDKAWFYSSSRYYSNYSARPIKKSYLFTDRSIYRPGQTVYFKGIIIESKENNHLVLSNYDTEVVFRDSNYKEITRQKVQTNEYGSYQGSFVIPSGVLLGVMTIRDKFGKLSISVEHYKRPKFEVVLDTLKKEVYLSDKVVVRGQAKSYSGGPISDAEVAYRVVRKIEYPYRSYFWWVPPISKRGEMEIASAITQTDAKGRFEIPFKAIPDLSINKDSKPVFNYQITAEVTDINGETQSRETFTKVGYHSLLLYLEAKSKWEPNKKEIIAIKAKNLNDVPVYAKGKLSLYRLKKQTRIIRKSYWTKIDSHLLSEEEFINHFPHDAYRAEDKPQNRKKEKRVWAIDFDTEKSAELELTPSSTWPEGPYVLIGTAIDSKGEKIEIEKFISLQNNKRTKLSEPKILDVFLENNQLEPGNMAVIRVGTSMDSLQFDYELYCVTEKIGAGSFVLTNEIRSVKIPIKEKHRGGIRFVYHAIGLSRDLSGEKKISVPFTNKELTIQTEVFRDKLRPGNRESWKLTIKGQKKEKVATEALIGMYDASLDALKPHNWKLNLYGNPYFKKFYSWKSKGFGLGHAKVYYPKRDYLQEINIYFPKLEWFGFGFYTMQHPVYLRGSIANGRVLSHNIEALQTPATAGVNANNATKQDEASPTHYLKKADKPTSSKRRKISIRKNLQETAFFFPQLLTNDKGEISFNFETPEALTQWKFMVLGHTKDLSIGKLEKEAVTQKELMVFPNIPRFVRQGDLLTISSKISNLSKKSISGIVELKVFDALTRKPLNKVFQIQPKKQFRVEKQGNTIAEWKMNIPQDLSMIAVQVTAKSSNFSDGEEHAIAVLSDRKLVTETLPFWISGTGTKSFTLNRIQNHRSTTLDPYRLTLELTSNPVWLAIKSLPFLMEYPYESLEQIFSRFYANSLATHLANSNPKIRRVFDSWKNTGALESNLEKNEELKQLILQESPWVRQAQSEKEQRGRLGQLFEINQMKDEQHRAIKKLEENQLPSGAWTWFKGGRENRTITRHIVFGFGRLKQLGIAYQSNNQSNTNRIITKAINYLDKELEKDYRRLISEKVNLEKYQIGYSKIHYLYARSFFKDIEIKKQTHKAYDYFYGKSKKNWIKKELSSQGMIALISYRNNDIVAARSIVRSLKENSIQNQELGMYWKENRGGYRWEDAPIETQSLLIEAFTEIENDRLSVDQMRIWLLKNKQTNRWKTTRATVSACYALIDRGTKWLTLDGSTELVLGSQTIKPKELEPGTGYFKMAWQKKEIKPQYANLTIKKKKKGIAWGALYYQYFEDLDKIETHQTPLELRKTVFVQKNTSNGPTLREISEKNTIQIGDLVKIKIELRVDRDMEFLHLKDMRASGLEPIQSLSGFRWQGGLGYYQATKDASTNFFFDRIAKGVYVFEYSLRANVAGRFSNGNATIQSVYSPEFSSYSNGLSLTIKP